ncbi:MAG TPA: hypothetical protein VHU19_17255 [Pyrinomonadaceae bacterium]|jgi:hypothetical protein|nr:hypothetical protein [Pyrinomonadaceae bacterium]
MAGFNLPRRDELLSTRSGRSTKNTPHARWSRHAAPHSRIDLSADETNIAESFALTNDSLSTRAAYLNEIHLSPGAFEDETAAHTKAR